MPKTGLKQNFEITTRGLYTKADAEFSLIVEGKELPSMAVLGSALEEAIQLIQNRVTESYKTIPARV